MGRQVVEVEAEAVVEVIERTVDGWLEWRGGGGESRWRTEESKVKLVT